MLRKIVKGLSYTLDIGGYNFRNFRKNFKSRLNLTQNIKSDFDRVGEDMNLIFGEKNERN